MVDAFLFIVFMLIFLSSLLVCGFIAWVLIKGHRVVIILSDENSEKFDRIKHAIREVELI
jgi:hypothetical protein